MSSKYFTSSPYN